MIQITRELADQIISHAKKELPIEACGYLAGLDGVVLKTFELNNIDNSPEHFSFDPAEQFKVYREARKLGIYILANYHSHPSTPSRPSQEDIRLANDPDISYVIISLAEKKAVIKSFRIHDNQSKEEEFIIIK